MDYRIVHRKTFKKHVDSMKKDGRSDIEIAWFFAGLKLGFHTATKVSERDSMACAAVAFEFQTKLDPEGVTWEKA